MDEVQKLTGDAQSALLKILEDTPSHVYFILCTTDPQKLLSTIRGRCQQLQTKPLNEQQMFSLLRQVVRKEGDEIEKQIYDQIIETAQGHPRNALQILEQVLKVPAEERLEISKRQIDNQAEIIELCRALLNASKWSVVKEIITKLKDQEAETIRRVVLGYMQAVLLKGENNQAAFIIENFWEPTYDVGFPYITYACYSVINSK
jgi:DNA polymerase-3 subunit gamma/tau